MKIESFLKLENGLLMQTDKGQVKITVWAPNILHVVYTMDEDFSVKDSFMVCGKPSYPVDYDIKEDENFIKLSTSEVQLVINRMTGAFSYYDRNGRLLTKEPDRGGKTLVPVDVKISVFGDNSKIKNEVTADGVKSWAEDVNQIVDRKAYHTKLEFEWQEDEALYGLGSHEEGYMNHRGKYQYLYQQNLKAVIPVLVSTRGYGILIDSYSFMIFRDNEHGSYIWTDVDDQMDYYFIYGPEFDDIVKGYRKLTGKVPLFPKWAYGYFQSKQRYRTQDELISVVKEYRERKIPLDVIVLDWLSWPGKLWGQKSFDPERFPNPSEMMEQLHKMNARLMISIWPNMSNDGPNQLEMKKYGFLLGNGSTYNAFDDRARELYWKQANEGLFCHGVDAWWTDASEPFDFDWKGEVKLEPEERMMVNTQGQKKYLDPEFLNAYSLFHSRGIYEGQRKTTNRKRVVNLTRSVYAGQQRYATITWSGDITASWNTLRKQIPSGLNFCVTGIPYWTVDIGAFFVKKGQQWFWSGDYDEGCEDPGYRELYVRWFQYGAFLPIFRSHGDDTPREVWRFGQPGDITYDTLVKFDYLRYRLMPYIYSLAGKVTHEDYTIMRALAFDFRHDKKTYNIDDQYMFGPAFLVNPVTRPMYYDRGGRELNVEKKTRPVYLPVGCDWYDFWTGERYEGGQTIEACATLDIMPLYVRAGSIVPMGPKIQYAGEKPGAPIELRIYGGADGGFDIYEDEGDNYNYEQGQYSWIRIKWNDSEKKLIFARREGSYPGMRQQQEFHVVLVRRDHGTGLEETCQADRIVEYNGEELIVKIES